MFSWQENFGSDIAYPSQRRESNKTIVSDADKAFESVIHTRQSKFAALRPDAILDLKMTSLHRNADTVAVQRENAKILGLALGFGLLLLGAGPGITTPVRK